MAKGLEAGKLTAGRLSGELLRAPASPEEARTVMPRRAAVRKASLTLLSQVRETAVSGSPQLIERMSGRWMGS